MKKSARFLFVIVLLSLLAACAGNTPIAETLVEDKIATIAAGTLTAISTSTSAPTETHTPEASPTPAIQCKGEYSGIVLTMPNALWNCVIEVLQDESEALYISSPVFEIRTAYHLGRGLWCDPNRDQNCVVTSFYGNELVELSLYKWYGENKEIFGIITIPDNPDVISLSIKYLDMEKRNLTQPEMEELLFFVDAIRIEKK